jgi:pyruvate dehydrogenase E1 component alpha subunit
MARTLHHLLRARKFDSVSIALQHQGAIETYGPARGQEAIHVGTGESMENGDWLFHNYRQPGLLLMRGLEPQDLWANNAGLSRMAWDFRATRVSPFTVPLGSQLLHAVGTAWASRLQGSDAVSVAFFGDGASTQGEVHEAMNFAAVFSAPVVFVCENNGWAISVPWEHQAAIDDIAVRAAGYGMPGEVVDGQDVDAVRASCSRAVARARDGGGPSLIEAKTYRLTGHTTSDDPALYRTEERAQEWAQRDPIEAYRRDHSVAPDVYDAAMAEIDQEFKGAVNAWLETRSAR